MDIITFGLSILSLVVADYSVPLSNKAEEYSQFQIIMNMYGNIASIDRDLVKYGDGSKEADQKLYRQSKEQMLNHYEIYCLHYLRSSIDQKIFEQLF